MEGSGAGSVRRLGQRYLYLAGEIRPLFLNYWHSAISRRRESAGQDYPSH
jgi:hypothetical protein